MTKIWECPNCENDEYKWNFTQAEYCCCTKCFSMFRKPDFFYREAVTAKMVKEYCEKHDVCFAEAKRILTKQSYDNRGG